MFLPFLLYSDQLEEVQSHLTDSPTYYCNIARSSYLYAKCLKSLGREQGAQDELGRSVSVHNKLRPEHPSTTDRQIANTKRTPSMQMHGLI